MNKLADLLPALPTESERQPWSPPPVVTPYLPEMAEREIKAHEKFYHMPAFIMAFEQLPHMCPNCGGFGVVTVRFCDGGPYSAPKWPNVPVTYFEGNGVYGSGWYKIKETRSYVCPECKGDNPGGIN